MKELEKKIGATRSISSSWDKAGTRGKISRFPLHNSLILLTRSTRSNFPRTHRLWNNHGKHFIMVRRYPEIPDRACSTEAPTAPSIGTEARLALTIDFGDVKSQNPTEDVPGAVPSIDAEAELAIEINLAADSQEPDYSLEWYTSEVSSRRSSLGSPTDSTGSTQGGLPGSRDRCGGIQALESTLAEAGIAEPSQTWAQFLEDEIKACRDEFSYQLLLILRDYLTDPRPFAQEAATAVAMLCDSTVQDRLIGAQSLPWLVWAMLLELIRRTHFLHDGMDRMVQLIYEFSNIEQGAWVGMTKRDAQDQINNIALRTSPGSYRLITYYRRDGGAILVGPDIPHRRAKLTGTANPTMYIPEATPFEWIAQYSFLGRLTGMRLVKWWRFVIWAMEDALESERGAGWSLDLDVLVAVELITRGGRVLLEACRDQSHPGLSLERWKCWALRFGEVANQVADRLRGSAMLTGQEMISLMEMKDVYSEAGSPEWK